MIVVSAAWDLKRLRRTRGKTERSFKSAALDIPLSGCEICRCRPCDYGMMQPTINRLWRHLMEWI